MVTYNYSVTKDQSNASIQNVIDRIVDELSTSPTIERDIEIAIGAGNFSGFTIPDGALFPLFNTEFKLVIKAAGDFYPIIDFNYSSEDQYTGIDIGSGNPNVTIRGLRIQYFAVGIRAGLNSHYPVVSNCIINNNRNAGIFFEQCNESVAVQNIIINGDYGIVVRLCKDSLVLHNTIFMNGAISTEVGKSISCIWAELANDYGGGLQDTGSLYLIGNVGWNTSGRCLTLFLSDVELPGAIISNYNDWVVGDSVSFIVVEDNAYYRGNESRPRRTFSNLASWKELGYDLNSKSEDPRFISPVKIRSSRNGYAIDLNILPVSPVLGMVPSFAYNPSLAIEWLPTYFDTSLISKDILKKNRSQSTTSAGANEKISTSGFFGQDVFSNPLDLATTKSCAVDPFFNILFKSLDIWYPKLHRGYFYSNEREYYLYSKKECKNIGELARTMLYLPAKINYSKPIKLYINGSIIQDSKYYDIVGNKLYIYHLDLPITNGEEEVELEAYISTWNSDAFINSKVLYRFKINEGITKYFLPDTYKAIGPVVITDDIAYPTDSDYITNREFSVSFDTYEQKSEIILANQSNLLYNSQFDYADENGAPIGWQYSDASIRSAEPPYYSVAGGNACYLEDNGFIRKVLPVDASGNYTLSLHTRSQGSGVCSYQFEYYDSNYDKLGYAVTGEFSLRDYWTRHSITLGNSGQDFDVLVPQVPYPCIDLGTTFVPDRAAHVSIKLQHLYNPAYTGHLVLDALQYESSSVPSLYHRRFFFNELTVEYETESDDNFIDTYLGISPVTSTNSDGFIYIPEIPAATYNGPNTPIITTLHEWKWPEGRKFVIPWARTKGKDKLRKRPAGKFHPIPEPKPEIITPVGYSAYIKTVDIYPSIPICSIGDNNGIGFIVKVTDSDNNPHSENAISISITDDNLRYPGMLSKKIFGLKEQLSNIIFTKTNSAGVVPLTWVPPTEISATYHGAIPTPTYSTNLGERVSVLTTEYPVSVESNGNIIILDYNNQIIPTYASSPRMSNYSPVYGNNSSTVKLEYPIKKGSVRVKVDNTFYTENLFNLLDSNQFYVDYENSIVSVKGRVANIYIEYIPSYVYVSILNPYKIMIYYDQVFDGYTNDITVGYDISIKLTVSAYDPALSTHTTKSFELVGQNPLMRKNTVFNTLALEF